MATSINSLLLAGRGLKLNLWRQQILAVIASSEASNVAKTLAAMLTPAHNVCLDGKSSLYRFSLWNYLGATI